MIRKEDRNPDFASHLRAEVVETARSPWQQIEITRHPIFGHQLVIDGDLQISESDHAYGVAMVSPLLQLRQLRRVAILGGGDGGVLWELLQAAERMEIPLEKATMIDIDGEVLRLCRTHLSRLCGRIWDHPQAEILTADAFAWIAEARDLDAVIYDLTMDPVREGQSREEFMAETLAMIARALRSGGVFSMQCCGEGEGNDELAAESRDLLAQIRKEAGRHFCDLIEQRVLIPSYLERWTFLSGRKPA
ncbi:spermidine synthase/spermine synthase [Geothermobacter ehrlichii]|uniref:Spermidine synthase/spermine synthase n=1 Tax=Geothermobacter ehrlichii TaxID=213224 RepID=A0A5D3WKS1_9BACT|nr:spermine synthase [Geothermobacter ehrlichii]TYO99604.1 spermidine synthase/spermine synthase [Geothermobacter ehrlichii]